MSGKRAWYDDGTIEQRISGSLGHFLANSWKLYNEQYVGPERKTTWKIVVPAVRDSARILRDHSLDPLRNTLMARGRRNIISLATSLCSESFNIFRADTGSCEQRRCVSRNFALSSASCRASIAYYALKSLISTSLQDSCALEDASWGSDCREHVGFQIGGGFDAMDLPSAQET